ncbi:MAG: M48 family metallopeptidase [Parcubacteria group bacterium]|nr:M48 family metallopeptidase [Parcubacteria group bacterium]
MEYTLKRSNRAKYMRLRVLPGGGVVVVAPSGIGEGSIERFVRGHAQWIERAITRTAHLKLLPISGRRAYLTHREEARAFLTERIEYWNKAYGFSYGRIAIKNTRRLWGSCSRKGNLNFSYALLFLPRELADYVVVHELCHLKEHNHSRDFWQLVAHTQPNHKVLRRELRRYVPRS